MAAPQSSFKLKLKLNSATTPPLPPTQSTSKLQPPEPLSDEELLPDGRIETEDIPLIQCEWEGCTECFWEVEPLVDHVTKDHIEPLPKNKMACEWNLCKFKGKNQSSKFALLTHLKSHSGEKPYICSRPECDKSFTREDARVKHMRTVHSEVIVTGKRGGGRKRKAADVDSIDGDGSASPSKRLKDEDDDDGDMEGSVSMAGPEDDPAQAQMLEDAQDLAIPDEHSAEVLQLAALHPELSIDLLNYLTTLAKMEYQTTEQEALVMEYEMLQKKEAQLSQENEKLLDQIWSQELGPEAQSLCEEIDLSHVPTLKWSLKRRTSLPAKLL